MFFGYGFNMHQDLLPILQEVLGEFNVMTPKRTLGQQT